jgi:hypothetical protein
MKNYHDFCMATAAMSAANACILHENIKKDYTSILMASQAIIEVIQSRKCVKMNAQECTTKVHGG